VLGVFWSRANRWGATAGMAAGLGLTLYYMVRNDLWLRGLFRIASPIDLWWGVQPISAAVFGVPLGVAVMVVVSFLTPAPGPQARAFVQALRTPGPG